MPRSGCARGGCGRSSTASPLPTSAATRSAGGGRWGGAGVPGCSEMSKICPERRCAASCIGRISRRSSSDFIKHVAFAPLDVRSRKPGTTHSGLQHRYAERESILDWVDPCTDRELLREAIRRARRRRLRRRTSAKPLLCRGIFSLRSTMRPRLMAAVCQFRSFTANMFRAGGSRASTHRPIRRSVWRASTLSSSATSTGTACGAARRPRLLEHEPCLDQWGRLPEGDSHDFLLHFLKNFFWRAERARLLIYLYWDVFDVSDCL